MENKEFFSELKVVLDCLRRQPHILGCVKIHLSQYDHASAVRKLAAPSLIKNLSVPKRFRKVRDYESDMCYFYDLVLDLYFLMYELLLDFGYDAVLVKRHMRCWLHKVASWHVNFRELGQLLKAYEEFLFVPLNDADDGIPKRPSYVSFKDECKTAFPSCHWWFQPIKGLITTWITKRDVKAFRLAYQAVAYMLRANLKSLDLRRELCDDYVAQEHALHKQTYDPTVMAEFKVLAYMALDKVRFGKHLSDFVPCHGPGASSGLSRKSLYFKYNALHFNRKQLRRIPLIKDFMPELELGKGSSPITSEIVDVPKNYNKRRIISKEPVTLQYIQHGLHAILYALIRDRHSLFFKHIDLEHSEWNGMLAELGSLTGDYATIDLSAASDSVTKTLIRCFPKWIRSLLLFFRSPATELPDGRLVDLEKFAPMGADTCFPVECIVFALCAILAIVRTERCDLRKTTYETLLLLLEKSSFRVYGDDIVIEERYVKELKYILKALNFKVNVRKSFTDRRVLNFRESCGYEYLNGLDVKPLRVARKRSYWHSIITSADDVTAIVSYANAAYDERMFLLRKLWLLRINNTVIEVPQDGHSPTAYYPLRRMIPFVHEDNYAGTVALKTFVPPTNYHLMRGGLQQAPFSENSRCDVFGLQQPLYWGLVVQNHIDRDRDRADIKTLCDQGFVPFEVDYIRWMEYWRNQLSPHFGRHYVPKELKLLQCPQPVRKDGQGCDASPAVLSTKTKLLVRPLVIT